VQQQQQQQQPPPAAAGSNLIPFELLVGVPLGNKRSIRVVIRIYIYTHKYNLFISFLFARVCSVTTKTGLIASFFGVFFSVSCVNKPEERINNGPTVPSHPRHISLTFFPPLFLSSFSFSFYFFFFFFFFLPSSHSSSSPSGKSDWWKTSYQMDVETCSYSGKR